ELRPEASAHELGDDTDLRLRDAQDLGQLVADAARALRRGVDGQRIPVPVGDEAVRLHGAVGLHLRAVRGVDHDVGVGEALARVAGGLAVRAAHVRAADVAALRNARGATPTSGGPFFIRRGR